MLNSYFRATLFILTVKMQNLRVLAGLRKRQVILILQIVNWAQNINLLSKDLSQVSW